MFALETWFDSLGFQKATQCSIQLLCFILAADKTTRA